MSYTIGNEVNHSLFISDLHLCHTRPSTTKQFLSFLQSIASYSDSLYILGDLFEYWAGDDDIENEHIQPIIKAIRQLSAQGTTVYFLHGNRDFLIAESFADACHISLLSDPTPLELYGKRIVLSHGDTLCSDDIAYQNFRKEVRQSSWQKNFLLQPLEIRKAQIDALRKRSEVEKSYKAESIMDVNSNAVESLIRTFNFPDLLIHGHTHRPARHLLEIDGHYTERWVLGDWYDQGSCLRLDANGVRNISITSS